MGFLKRTFTRGKSKKSSKEGQENEGQGEFAGGHDEEEQSHTPVQNGPTQPEQVSVCNNDMMIIGTLG